MTEGSEYDYESSADVMTASDSHGCRDPIRPLRGRAFLELVDDPPSRLIVCPDTYRKPEEDRIHMGRVLWLGPPARLTDHPDSPEIPWDIEVGDVVYFVYAIWLKKMRSGLEVPGHAGKVVCVGQEEIQCVST